MKTEMVFNVPHADRNKAGVYLIRNSIDSRVLVGSTTALRARYRTYCNLLKKGRYPNERLQKFVNEHSINGLSFELICLCPAYQLLQTEQFYMDYYGSTNEAAGFNRAPYAGSSKGLLASPQTKAKLSESVKKRPPEAHAKNSAALTGRKRNPEIGIKISATKKAQGSITVLSAESKAKISAKQKGVPKSPEARANMSAAAKARANSPEAQAKRQQQFASPEAKASFTERMRQGWETKRKLK